MSRNPPNLIVYLIGCLIHVLRRFSSIFHHLTTSPAILYCEGSLPLLVTRGFDRIGFWSRSHLTKP